MYNPTQTQISIKRLANKERKIKRKENHCQKKYMFHINVITVFAVFSLRHRLRMTQYYHCLLHST